MWVNVGSGLCCPVVDGGCPVKRLSNKHRYAGACWDLCGGSMLALCVGVFAWGL